MNWVQIVIHCNMANTHYIIRNVIGYIVRMQLNKEGRTMVHGDKQSMPSTILQRSIYAKTISILIFQSNSCALLKTREQFFCSTLKLCNVKLLSQVTTIPTPIGFDCVLTIKVLYSTWSSDNYSYRVL